MAEARQVLGVRLREYMLIEEIGKGTFGVVFLAQKNSKKYAIKRLKVRNGHKQTKRELQIADHLTDHPNLVPVMEYFFHPDKPRVYLVMEYCPEGNLNDHIINKRLNLGKILGYMLHLAKAVHHLHSNRVMHRDIKPENVLMVLQNDQYMCKICDFSISRLLTDSNFAETVCGTFMYVAPEVLDRPRYTFSVDIFSLGLVYFVMKNRCVKRIDGRDALVPYVTINGKEKPLLHLLRRNLSKGDFIQDYYEDTPELGRIVYRMLDIEPEKRPDMVSVVSDIAEVKGSVQSQGASRDRKLSHRPGARAGDSGLSDSFFSMSEDIEDGEIKVVSASQIDVEEDDFE